MQSGNSRMQGLGDTAYRSPFQDSGQAIAPGKLMTSVEYFFLSRRSSPHSCPSLWLIRQYHCLQTLETWMYMNLVLKSTTDDLLEESKEFVLMAIANGRVKCLAAFLVTKVIGNQL
mmetsp:Transcript_13962/g.21742  ORF Transcript_13962/g.21742 Transcript_13962/m.21742 type:complete len:116 (-) Transcript_13962:111-458(-)